MERFRFWLVACAAVAVGTAVVMACDSAPAPTKTPLRTTPEGDDDDGKKKKNDDDDDVTPIMTEADPPLPDGGKPPGRVYAQTATALYLFDPLVKTLKKIGDFTNLDPRDRVLDIAVDRDSAMYGTTDKGLIKIDPITAACSYVKQDPGLYPNALTFVPMGTVDATKEALVGYQQGVGAFGATKYVRVDPTTGVITPIGELNATSAALQWKSSGDIIALRRDNSRAFLTVRLFSPDGGVVDPDPKTDSLAEVNPTTGAIIKIIGDIGQPDFYGLGQWAGTAYGFNAGGNIVEINMTTGQGTTILTLKEDGGTGSWFGAGVTTDSPTKP